MTHRRSAVVVGGGLAGMVAALRLAQGGVAVELHEASERLGGKAGSDWREDGGPGYLSDHGYHVFPAWYHNTWSLLAELGVDDGYQERRHFWRLGKDRAQALRSDGPALEAAARRAWLGPRSLLSAVDLVSRREEDLDDLSLAGFLRSRWYNGQETGSGLRDISLKGLGNPASRASSVTFRANMRLLLKALHEPNWSPANGPLQERFIDPIADALDDAGVRVHLGRPLTGIDLTGSADAATVERLRFGDDVVEVADRPVVLALPHERLRPLLLPHQWHLPDELTRLGLLASRPMTALDVHLGRPVDGLTGDRHLILDGSRYHLTVLDIRPLWGDHLPGSPDHPVLQVIAADTRELDGCPEEDLVAALLDDLLAFFPFLELSDVTRVVAHPNDDVPLFMNDVGTDRCRPRSDRTHGTNLLVAGDWCRTPIMLACMEGAVVSGTQAAATVLAAEGLPVPPLRLPPTRASIGAWFLRVLLAPIAFVGGLPLDAYRWVRRRSFRRVHHDMDRS